MGNVVSPIQKRILSFFHEHPHALETARGIATWLGQDVQSIQEALNGLVSRKWLAVDTTAAVTGYGLTREERFLTQIRQILEPS